MDEKKDIFEKIFINPVTIMLFVGCLLFIVIVTSVSPFWNPFAPSGIITGNFVSAEHRGFGDFCGQYPYTRIKLSNYSVEGDYDTIGSIFYFGNQYKDVDKIITGQFIRISYHQESRPSDTTSGNTIYYWVIDNIN